jgi:zinc resistance-associated protein
MWKNFLAGTLGLLATGLWSAPSPAADKTTQFRPASTFVLTTGHIARIKRVLHLTPEQERHWPAVESALHDIVRHQNRDGSAGDPSTRINNAQLQRLAAAAMPLIMSLGEDQKREAMKLARAMGLERVVSAF